MQNRFRILPPASAHDLLALTALCLLISFVRFNLGDYNADDSIVFSCGKSLYLTGRIENTYWYHFMDTFNFPCFSWYLQLPFFYLIPEQFHLTLLYIIPTFYLLLSLWVMYHLYGTLANRLAMLLIGAVFVTSGLLHSLRFEVMCMPLLLLLPAIVKMQSTYRFLICGLVLGVLGNIHPAPMAIGLMFCLFYEFESRQSLTWQLLLKYGLYTAAFAVLLYLPLILKNHKEWVRNVIELGVIKDRHYLNAVSVNGASKLVLPFAPVFICLFLLRNVIFTNRVRLLFAGMILLFCFLIGRPLYFIYILPFWVYCVSESTEKVNIGTVYFYSIITVFVASLFFVQVIVRVRSADVFTHKKIIHESLAQVQLNKNETLWVSPKYGLYTKHFERTKAFNAFLMRFMKKPYTLKRGDVVYLTSSSDIRNFPKFFSVSPENKLVRKRMINPIPIIGVWTSNIDSLLFETVVVM